MNREGRKIIQPVISNLFFAGIFLLLLSGCHGGTKYSLSTATLNPEPTRTDTPTILAEITSTPTPTPLVFDTIPILVTQGPISISTVSPDDPKYIYKDTIVKFPNIDWNSAVFVNLDELTDSDPKNGDFVIYIDSGSIGTTFELYPTNFARYHYSGKKVMDDVSCAEIFPKTLKEEFEQYSLNPRMEGFLITGKVYCILTNKGHMATVSMTDDTQYPDSQGNVTIVLKITVYSKTEDELFIPAPSPTPGPSPTPTTRYSNRGIGNDQAKYLDESIQKFIDAMSSTDKLALSDMIDYPFEIRLIYNHLEIVHLENSNDFLKNFDKIFPEKCIKQFAGTTLINNVSSYPGAIILELNGDEIRFTDEGKIQDISFKNCPR
ncbi:MAG: hypothetical protein VB013_13790 [Anaerolineaceae bacterium]|nr:hypothetical protein [Anaerolineaceae bacterium]